MRTFKQLKKGFNSLIVGTGSTRAPNLLADYRRDAWVTGNKVRYP